MSFGPITHAGSQWHKLCRRYELDPQEATAFDVEAAIRSAGLQPIDVFGHLLSTVGSSTTIDEFVAWCRRNTDFAARLMNDIAQALEAQHARNL